MTFKRVDSRNLEAVMRADLDEKYIHFLAAIRRTARSGVAVIQSGAPKAFGQLAESVHAHDTASGSMISVEAPHAEVVEVGSRPHIVPLEDLIAWVKLRGTLYVAKADTHSHGRRRERSWISQVQRVGAEIKSMMKDGATPVDAPDKIARRIQYAISRGGTKAHWFVRQSIPHLIDTLALEMRTVK